MGVVSTVFCVIYSLLMFVSDASGDHGGNVLGYGSCYGFVYCEDRFLLFPHVVDVSVLSICIVLCDFVVVIYMCLLYICSSSCGSGACCFVWIEIVCLCPVGMIGYLLLLCLYRCVLMVW